MGVLRGLLVCVVFCLCGIWHSSAQNCAVIGGARIDCAPQINITMEPCMMRGCCFNPQPGYPSCYFPGARVNITTVHMVQGCHLDVGFANTSVNIVNLYFDTHFPNAVQVGRTLRVLNGTAKLKFTTQSYLVSLYLDCPPGMGLHCPSESAVSAFIEAISYEEITWHAFPFNAELEVMDPALIQGAIQMTHNLDAKLGLPPKVTMSQRDVPATSRSAIPILLSQGVRALTVGVNGASTAPNVPPAFIWEDPVSSRRMLSMWHPGGYGGLAVSDAVIVPGLDHALVFAWRGDNAGPPPVTEVLADFAAVQLEFPGARVISSTFDEFVTYLQTAWESLPVLYQELGDTWLYGCPSDPVKLATMRAMFRARTACLQAGVCAAQDYNFQNFTRLLIKGAEHTWGLDVKTFLKDWGNWTNDLFESVRGDPNFQLMEWSWNEQRRWAIEWPLQALNGEDPYTAIMEELEQMKPEWPSTIGWAAFTPQQVDGKVFSVSNGRLEVSFDANTGAINWLFDVAANVAWASPQEPLALFQYMTYNATDYATLLEEYMFVLPPPSWAPFDFGKPGLPLGPDRHFLPALAELFYLDLGVNTFMAHLVWEEEAYTDYGGVTDIWITFEFYNTTLPPPSTHEREDAHTHTHYAPVNQRLHRAGTMGVSVMVTVDVFNKTATRIPEAMFFTFQPHGTGNATSVWSMDKLGEPVNPLDVAWGGSQHQHGILSGVTFQPAADFELMIESLDAGVVVAGAPTPFPVPTTEQPDMSYGCSFNFWNNIWGTNYVMWTPFNDEDRNMRFRFSLSSLPTSTSSATT